VKVAMKSAVQEVCTCL